MTEEDERAAELIENAGAIFFGAWSTEPVGDYFAGPNHVLPTVGTARFSSPLGVYDFLKRQSSIATRRDALAKNAAAIAAMAGAEGLDGAQARGLDQDRGPRAAGRESEVRPTRTDACLEKIKPAVRAISAYTLAPTARAIKINQNENPFDMPEEIKQEVGRRLARPRVVALPGLRARASCSKRSPAFAGWKPEGMLAGNGSNELIQATADGDGRARARASLIPEPTFTLYRQIVTVLGGEVLGVPLTRDLQFDMDAIGERAAARARGRDDALLAEQPDGLRRSTEERCGDGSRAASTAWSSSTRPITSSPAGRSRRCSRRRRTSSC